MLLSVTAPRWSSERIPENAEATKKKNDKRYRENAKEKRRKKAEVAQAGEQALDRKQRCLVEWHGGLQEAPKYEVRPTTT